MYTASNARVRIWLRATSRNQRTRMTFRLRQFDDQRFRKHRVCVYAAHSLHVWPGWYFESVQHAHTSAGWFWTHVHGTLPPLCCCGTDRSFVVKQESSKSRQRYHIVKTCTRIRLRYVRTFIIVRYFERSDRIGKCESSRTNRRKE